MNEIFTVYVPGLIFLMAKLPSGSEIAAPYVPTIRTYAPTSFSPVSSSLSTPFSVPN